MEILFFLLYICIYHTVAAMPLFHAMHLHFVSDLSTSGRAGQFPTSFQDLLVPYAQHPEHQGFAYRSLAQVHNQTSPSV